MDPDMVENSPAKRMLIEDPPAISVENGESRDALCFRPRSGSEPIGLIRQLPFSVTMDIWKAARRILIRNPSFYVESKILAPRHWILWGITKRNCGYG